MSKGTAMSDDAPQVPNMLTGRCMCGAVTYKVTEKSMADGLCHCDGHLHTPQRADDHRRDGGLR
jgi:hypothetical protein